MQSITMTDEAYDISIQRPTEYENKGFTDEVYVRLQRYNAAMSAMEWMIGRVTEWLNENATIYAHFDDYSTLDEMVEDLKNDIKRGE